MQKRRLIATVGLGIITNGINSSDKLIVIRKQNCLGRARKYAAGFKRNSRKPLPPFPFLAMLDIKGPGIEGIRKHNIKGSPSPRAENHLKYSTHKSQPREPPLFDYPGHPSYQYAPYCTV